MNLPLCMHCAACCKTGLRVIVRRYEELYNSDYVYEIEGSFGFTDRYMKMEGGVCIALVDNRCSIYDKRPEVCRMFHKGSVMCLGAIEDMASQNGTEGGVSQSYEET